MKTWEVIATVLAVLGCSPIQPLAATASSRQAIWVDTDAACGVSPLKDVDDCLALLAIARRSEFQIVAVSTSYGNARRRDVDHVIVDLLPFWREEFGAAPRVVRGARKRGDCRGNQASASMAAALESGPLTILALGPLTTVACALRANPDGARNVVRIVFVGGARAGHVFHPAEGASGAILFGHGPIARDMNVQLDPDAVDIVLGSGVPVVLAPYELARQTALDEAVIDRLSSKGPLSREVARRSRPWLKTWRDVMGRDGFFPFDMMAVVAMTTPRTLSCSSVGAHITADRAISGNAFGPQRLLIGALPWPEDKARTVVWCDGLQDPVAPATLLGAAP